MANQFMNMLNNMAPRSNRSLADLQNSKDQLKGMDAMELRGWASQNPLVPARDLSDSLGTALLATFQGQDDAVKIYLDGQSAEKGKDAVVKEVYAARWGPTQIPILNVVLLAVHHTPGDKQPLLDLTRYLVGELGVPVDGTDVTGASALYWSISCKPFSEPDFAQILFDAGGSVNQKNRFGGTAASEIAQADLAGDTSRNVAMLKWFLEHGGDIDGKDNDGMNVRMLVDMMAKRIPGMAAAVKEGRQGRQEGQCENCGRHGADKSCARCKKVKYCEQECQKVDWKGHKKGCKAIA
ncbi:MYND-type zinc finger protein samB [Parastagonospora nodorum]|nr:MYND-type zinc finger protein samB [Parastagonospora nodorum]KAH4079451.1 MYND-type zinc finger protein samB [Parastagonospora nodorum]KAH4211637.1 MYND-type zinc finger protein samB [Parastagonospora nodorum]KAH4299209.1 MYND-type zinc finger protein samB [Parastagonospora nodorum]KAH4300953.1 MYND-type zinc finger protein samB [Parastagonospora nodorum]